MKPLVLLLVAVLLLGVLTAVVRSGKPSTRIVAAGLLGPSEAATPTARVGDGWPPSRTVRTSPRRTHPSSRPIVCGRSETSPGARRHPLLQSGAAVSTALVTRCARRLSLDWAALAQCESSGHVHDNTGNGYYGLFQMDLDFWATYGGHRYASRPDLATRGQQLVVALNGYRARGSQPWPQCGYLLGGSR